jgi:8-oxo-dGTP pyrophosphatase MutT (NUDIX family)
MLSKIFNKEVEIYLCTMEKNENPWKVTSEEEKYDNPWINVKEYGVINPGGGSGIYGKVSFKYLAIGIIPIDDENNTWLVGQHRFTLDEYSWEIPMGGGTLNIDPVESAKRELKEETGIEAKEWEHILKIHTSNSVTDELGHVYLAKDLSFGDLNLEETESDLKVKKLKIHDALKMVEEGSITDAISLAGLLKVARILNI